MTVVVVANLYNRNDANPHKPLASKALLDSISTELRKRVSPSIMSRIHVVNPAFETISARFRVSFKPGEDVGYRIGTLRGDVKRFLSPWAYEDGRDITFGGRIHSSMIVNFIDERDYVDAVLDFELFHDDEDLTAPVQEAVAKTARSILVAGNAFDIEAV